MASRQYRLTRDLPADAPGNFSPRDLKAGDILYQCFGAYAVTNVDLSRGACLTEDPDGGYPGFEVPLSAVEEVQAGVPLTPRCDGCNGCCGTCTAAEQDRADDLAATWAADSDDCGCGLGPERCAAAEDGDYGA